MSAATLIGRLEARVAGYGSPAAVVAFSGGVDSSVVLAVAARALGPERVEAVTAVSPSLAEGELEAARHLAASLGVRHRPVETHELEREAYARNDAERCFHCKTELYGTLRRLVREHGDAGGTAVLAGANADDLREVRPGLLAARQQGIANPLLEEGVGKDGVRDVARHLGLPVADKPALACLSSRVLTGIRITPELLERIDRAEREVRGLGFDQVRVRHLGDTASIEVPAGDVPALLGHPRLGTIVGRIADLGWTEVTVDRSGYRPGSVALPPPTSAGPAGRATRPPPAPAAERWRTT